MDPKTILEGYKSKIWPQIEKYLSTPSLPIAFAVPKKYKKSETLHWQITREYPERKGKYIRPTLVCLTAEAMGVPLKKTLLMAAAMQLSEEWLLIHDDFEDNSPKRRGKPSLHMLYGNELAVNAGDALQVIMWRLLLDNRIILKDKLSNQIANEFFLALSRTTIGQSTEIAWMQGNKQNFTDSDWYFIADGKTSYYTIACPMRLGAILGGATKVQLDALAQFGVYLGRCFQLVDDILDVTSDFEGLKEYANDVYEGKRTVILGHLLRTANKQDKKKLIAIFKKAREEKTKAEVDWVLSRMKQYGSINHAQILAKKFKNKAYSMFEKDLKFLKHEPARSKLATLINFILERKY
jgi:geranylgeranyl diphosphate synthase type II